MAMIPRCRCWRREPARPKPAACGPMSATNARIRASVRRAAVFFYSPDRKGEHAALHLKPFKGVLHADGYAGFNAIFAAGAITEAACFAHVRRKFLDVHAASGSPIAKEA